MTPALALDDGHIGWFRDPRIDHDDASVRFGSGTPHEYLTPVNGRCHSGTSGSQADQAITGSATADWPSRPLLSVLAQGQDTRNTRGGQASLLRGTERLEVRGRVPCWPRPHPVPPQAAVGTPAACHRLTHPVVHPLRGHAGFPWVRRRIPPRDH